MPQMAPISWLSLFIMFSASLIVFTMMNYFSFYTQPPKTKTMKKNISSKMNWKW